MPSSLRSSDEVINFVKSQEFSDIIRAIVKEETCHLQETINDLRNQVTMLKETNIELIHMLSNKENQNIKNNPVSNISESKSILTKKIVAPKIPDSVQPKIPRPNSSSQETTNTKTNLKEIDKIIIDNNKNNTELWSTVIGRKDKRKRRSVIRGSDSTAQIKGVESYNHLHVYNLDPKLTAEDLNNYMKSKKIERVQCELLKSKHPEKYSSFKVSYPMQYHDEVHTAEFWPENACINRFLFRLLKPKEDV